MNNNYQRLNKPVEDLPQIAEKIYKKSIEVVEESQLETGGMVASLKGTRYFGHVYPRDHAYMTRALISAGNFDRSRKAIEYILTCELSPNSVMFQRYDEKGKSSSNKPPQIDGNAQTLISISDYYKATNDKDFIKNYKKEIDALLRGLQNSTHHFKDGSLIFCVNGIIEFAPFEEGYEIYTNAVTYAALCSISEIYSDVFEKKDQASHLAELAQEIKQGIESYLYHPLQGGFMSGVRPEPNPSLILAANLKSFLALVDHDVFDAKDEKILKSLEYHLAGTKNEELGGYNRYAHLIARHNFGDGPWPMVMMRLADCYVKQGKKDEAKKCVEWVLNVAMLNEDVPFGLPEHVATKEEFIKEYETYKKITEVAPRPNKGEEYKTIENAQMFKKYELAYAVNPLTWSHAMFVIVWNRIGDKL